MEYTDKRQRTIDSMNAKRLERGQTALIPRQEHLVREFTDEDGTIAAEDVDLLLSLLASNSV